MPNVQVVISLSDTQLSDLASVEITTAKGKSRFPLNANGQGGPFSFLSSAPADAGGYCVAFEGPDGSPTAFPGPEDDPNPPDTGS